MTVTTATSTSATITTHTGTLAEVVNALEASGINDFRNVKIYYNGTNITAVFLTR